MLEHPEHVWLFLALMFLIPHVPFVGGIMSIWRERHPHKDAQRDHRGMPDGHYSH